MSKRQRIVLEYDDPEDEAVIQSPKPPSRTTFKRISKQEAENRKREADTLPKDVPKGPKPKAHGLSEKAKQNLERIRKSREEIRKEGEKNSQENVHFDEIPTENLYLEDFDAEDALQVERDWYDAEESYSAPVVDVEPVVEPKLSRKQRVRNAYKTANEMWENRQMEQSGISSGRRRMSQDHDMGKDVKQILVHHLSPPFLEGSTVYAKRQEMVSVVKNPQGEMAEMARKGSLAVQSLRQQREAEKKAKDSTSMTGTRLGNLMGVGDGEKEKNGDAKPSVKKVPPPDLSAILTQRRQLPAFAVRDKLLSVIRDNQVVVIVGETGSGKTTQLTQFLREDGYAQRGMIGCTQPRRVAAVSVAQRVAIECNVEVGKEVGFTIRFEDRTDRSTQIKYMTDGVLLAESLGDPDLDKYSCIIIDEAHERSLNTDVLLGFFKGLLARRRDIKLIVTSATLNAQRFCSFFGNAPYFTIPGRTFPVDVLYSQMPVSDYVEAAVKQILTIHLGSAPGDILVFMTGQEDIEATCELVQQRLKELDAPDLAVLPIYSSLPADVQNKIFDKSSTRKCVVATNIAETSLTVDGVMFVVDCGFSKLKVFNPKLGMDTLQVTPISLAQANQRSGRAGRTGPGTGFRLYTEIASRDEMYEQPIPEIQRTNLSNTLLLLKSLHVKDLSRFPFLDAPPSEAITSSLYELWVLGALDNFGNLTRLGSRMASFPMEPALGKLLIKSHEFKCSEEMVTIVGMLSVPNVFYRPKERQQEADHSRERFFVAESDHLTLLNVYSQWKSNKYSDAWCARHFLHSRSLRRAKDIREQLVSIMRQQKMQVCSSGADWDIIRKCICSCFFQQAAKVVNFGEYAHLRNTLRMVLHPTSALYGLGDLPTYIVYHELILTSKEYMSGVTAVEPEWLAEFGHVFYSLKKPGRFVSARENQALKQQEFQDALKREQKNQKEERRSDKDEKAKPLFKKRVVRNF